MAINFKLVDHHIRSRAQARLCDGAPAINSDKSSEDLFKQRDARRATTLCPDCKGKGHYSGLVRVVIKLPPVFLTSIALCTISRVCTE